MIPTMDAFRKGLAGILLEATSRGQSNIQLSAGDLHRRVGGYPGTDHRMPMCCNAMYELMHDGDSVVAAPPRKKGASLLIEYLLPRA